MVYRAEKCGFINKRVAKEIWIEFSRCGWRQQEPGNVRPDRATRFEQLIDTAVTQRNFTWQRIAELMGVRESDLRQRVRMAMGISDLEGGDEAEILGFKR
jgi:hypothetical protein